MADVTDQTFGVEVMERSATVPVVVDLWAEWCGPCKQLGPVLEQVIADTGGRVELAKVDVDSNPAVAGMFKVQSIPAVYAVVDGAVVDGFLGAQPERQVREFVERLLPSEEETEVQRLLAAGDETSLRAALELEPANDEIVLALAELLASSDAGEEATALLQRVPDSPASRRIAALTRVGPAPAGAEITGRLEMLLERVKDDEDARAEYVDLIELLPEDERGQWRRQLSARLF
ncbi:MAG: thioredoxin domain-containing protein [Microthrixaceae bacterium]|jgi:putative thioredoxin